MRERKGMNSGGEEMERVEKEEMVKVYNKRGKLCFNKRIEKELFLPNYSAWPNLSVYSTHFPYHKSSVRKAARQSPMPLLPHRKHLYWQKFLWENGLLLEGGKLTEDIRLQCLTFENYVFILILCRFRVWGETEISLPLSCLLWTQASVSGPSGSVARLLYTVHFFYFHFSFTIFVFQFTKSFFCSWSINTTTPCFLYIVTIVALNWWSDFFSRKHYSFQCKQWLEPLIYLHIHISLH